MKTEGKKENRSLYALILVFVLLAAGIITAGMYYYANYEKHLMSEVEAQLTAITEFKVDQMVQWRKERLGDGQIFYMNNDFSAILKRYIQNPNDGDARARILTWVGKIQRIYGYDLVMLLDAQLQTRLVFPENRELARLVIDKANTDSLLEGKVAFQDFYRNEQDHRVYLKILIPILHEMSPKRLIGVLALRIDPEQYLYPLIKKWPIPSETGETLIIRREGNDAVFLNQLRFRENTALNFRTPLSNERMPAVKAALGQEGIVEGNDYRGVPVIADVRAVPGSPWFLVARMDIAEVAAPLRERLFVVVGFIAVLIFGAAAGVGFVWRQQRMRFYLEQHEADEALRASEERYRTTMLSVGDGVIATDTEGRVEMLNRVAAELTGRIQEEARGKPLEEIFRIVNEETRQTVENPVRRVMREGVVVGLANHTMLIAKDGMEHPIADSGAPICNEKGEITGVVLVFRDQTVERAVQKSLQDSERKFRETVTHLDEGYYSCMMDGVLLEHNQAFNRILGFDIVQDLKGEKLPDFWQNPDERKAYLQELMSRGSIMNYLINAKTISGEKVVVMANSHVVKDEKGGLVRIEGTFTDFTERKQAEEAVRNSETKLRAVLDATPFPVAVVDVQDNNIRYWSRSALKLFGHTAPTAPEWYQLAYPDPDYRREVVDRWKPHLEQAKLSGQSVNTGEYRITCNDGSVRMCELYATFLSDNLIVTFNDITERKRAEEKTLHQVEELHRWQEVTFGREDRIRQLKDEVNELLVRLKEGVRYPSQEGESDKKETAKG